ELVARFQDEAQRAGCVLRHEVAPSIVGDWDRLRLEQVLVNLIDNALKYGAGKPVLVTVARQDDRAVVTVRDHGIGIVPELQPRIFERFERAVSERNYGGLGLGLYIVRTIVRAMGGEVRVESTPGEGATFVV